MSIQRDHMGIEDGLLWGTRCRFVRRIGIDHVARRQKLSAVSARHRPYLLAITDAIRGPVMHWLARRVRPDNEQVVRDDRDDALVAEEGVLPAQFATCRIKGKD